MNILDIIVWLVPLAVVKKPQRLSINRKGIVTEYRLFLFLM